MTSDNVVGHCKTNYLLQKNSITMVSSLLGLSHIICVGLLGSPYIKQGNLPNFPEKSTACTTFLKCSVSRPKLTNHNAPVMKIRMCRNQCICTVCPSIQYRACVHRGLLCERALKDLIKALFAYKLTELNI